MKYLLPKWLGGFSTVFLLFLFLVQPLYAADPTATPTATLTPTGAVSDTPTPTSSPSVTPSSTPTSSPTLTPQPTQTLVSPTTSAEKPDKKAVLGSATSLGSTSSGLEIAKWALAGALGMGAFILAFKLMRSHGEE